MIKQTLNWDNRSYYLSTQETYTVLILNTQKKVYSDFQNKLEFIVLKAVINREACFLLPIVVINLL